MVGLRDDVLPRDHGHGHAQVLRVAVDLVAREGLVDDLGRPDVLLQLDRVALGLERLLVELTEHELLGEVLRAERDGRLALARLVAGRGRARVAAARRAVVVAAAGGQSEDREHGEQQNHEHGGLDLASSHWTPSLDTFGLGAHAVAVSTFGSSRGFFSCRRSGRGVTAYCRRANTPSVSERERRDRERSRDDALRPVGGLVHDDVAEAAAARQGGERRGGDDVDGRGPDAREHQRQRERQLNAHEHLPPLHAHRHRRHDRVLVDPVDGDVGVREHHGSGQDHERRHDVREAHAEQAEADRDHRKAGQRAARCSTR